MSTTTSLLLTRLGERWGSGHDRPLSPSGKEELLRQLVPEAIEPALLLSREWYVGVDAKEVTSPFSFSPSNHHPSISDEAFHSAVLRQALVLFPLELALVAPHVLARLTPTSFAALLPRLDLSVPDEWGRCLLALQYLRWRQAAATLADLQQRNAASGGPAVQDATWSRLAHLARTLAAADPPALPEVPPKSVADLGTHAAALATLRRPAAIARFLQLRSAAAVAHPATGLPLFLKSKHDYALARRWADKGLLNPANDLGPAATSPGPFRFAVRLPAPLPPSPSSSSQTTAHPHRFVAFSRVLSVLLADFVVAVRAPPDAPDTAAADLDVYLVRVQRGSTGSTAVASLRPTVSQPAATCALAATPPPVSDAVPVAVALATTLGPLAAAPSAAPESRWHVLRPGDAAHLFAVPTAAAARLTTPPLRDLDAVSAVLDAAVCADDAVASATAATASTADLAGSLAGFTDAEADRVAAAAFADASAVPRLCLSVSIEVVSGNV
ncbi:hypothetical protein HK405_015323 [Cladochytrium tenue]|nr:hypothetical protein HK405_015323 [Cladochytrium tenue]